MSRCKSLIAILAILIVATALAAIALPQKAEAVTLKGKLRVAKRALRHYNHRLTTARGPPWPSPSPLQASRRPSTPPPRRPLGSPSPDPSVSPTPVPSPVPSAAPATPSVDELKARIAKARRAVRIWKLRVQRLAKQYRLQRQMAEWERRGKWMPIIEVAAAKYHVRAAGIYRMMMRESGGQRYAGSSSAFKGLFQYCTSTWSASWNPYRHDSIYDGSSQIFATCYAVSRGMGPQMWTTTFASQY